jgi:short-subunit dehydrogenase
VKAIVIWDINEKNALAVAQEIEEETGVQAKAIQCDVSDRVEVQEAAKITR